MIQAEQPDIYALFEAPVQHSAAAGAPRQQAECLFLVDWRRSSELPARGAPTADSLAAELQGAAVAQLGDALALSTAPHRALAAAPPATSAASPRLSWPDKDGSANKRSAARDGPPKARVWDQDVARGFIYADPTGIFAANRSAISVLTEPGDGSQFDLISVPPVVRIRPLRKARAKPPPACASGCVPSSKNNASKKATAFHRTDNLHSATCASASGCVPSSKNSAGKKATAFHNTDDLHTATKTLGRTGPPAAAPAVGPPGASHASRAPE